MRRSSGCRLLTAAFAIAALVLPFDSESASSRAPRWARDLASAELLPGGYVHEDDGWVTVQQELTGGRGAEGRLSLTWVNVWEHIGEDKQSLQFHIPFDDALETLEALKVSVQKGSVHRALRVQSSAVEFANSTAGLVTSERVRTIETPSLRPGDRVFATWTLVSKSDFPGEHLIAPGDSRPVSRLKVRARGGVELDLVSPEGGVMPVASEGALLTEIPAIHRLRDTEDVWRASPLMTSPYFVFSTYPAAQRTWSHASARNRALYDAVLDGERAAHATPAHVLKARELTDGLATEYEKIGALVKFAQSLVYRNIAWGKGAYEPEPPSEALRTMSGDCKAKTLLLSAMLEEIGVASTPVLARLSLPYIDYRGPASTGIFNHVLLAIRTADERARRGRLMSGPGKGWVLFDPTDSLAAFGVPPNGLQGTTALWLGEPGAPFTIDFAETADRFGVRLDFELAGSDAARFHLTVEGASVFALAARQASHASGLAPQIRRHAEEGIRYEIPNVAVDAFRFQPPDHTMAQSALVEISGTVPRAAMPLSDSLMLVDAPTKIIRLALGLPDAVRRLPAPVVEPEQSAWHTPACCSAHPFWRQAEIKLRLPEGWSIEQQPDMEAIAAPWMEAGITAGQEAWRLSMRGYRGNFAGETAPQRVADFNSVLTMLDRGFIVRRDAAPAVAAGSASSSSPTPGSVRFDRQRCCTSPSGSSSL